MKYDALVQRWVEQDAAIAELIRKLVCALPCWRCVDRVPHLPAAERPPLRGAVARAATGRSTPTCTTCTTCLYWLSRDKDAKERRFNRIQAVLAAWASPAKTIDAMLSSNQALIDAASKLVGTNPAAAVYDVFLKLVPLDLAIAPPARIEVDHAHLERVHRVLQVRRGQTRRLLRP